MHHKAPRPFLARPFWRDYVLGGVLIGLGFALSAPHGPLEGAPGHCLGVIGVIIFLCACGWSIAQMFRSHRDTTHRD
jgi:hypothetical protein